jgi:hypothetical protein
MQSNHLSFDIGMALAADQGASSKGTVMLSIHGVAAGAAGFSNR